MHAALKPCTTISVFYSSKNSLERSAQKGQLLVHAGNKTMFIQTMLNLSFIEKWYNILKRSCNCCLRSMVSMGTNSCVFISKFLAQIFTILGPCSAVLSRASIIYPAIAIDENPNQWCNSVELGKFLGFDGTTAEVRFEFAFCSFWFSFIIVFF